MPLRLVMPVSQRDVNQLAANVDLIRALGGVPRHHIMLLPTRSVIPHAYQAAERLKAWAASVEVIEWGEENYNTQPLAGNMMWQHAVEENLKKYALGERIPWFFMEADCTPLCEGWADKMESEYGLSGCFFMGTQMDSRFITGKDKDGKLTFTTKRYIEGQPENIPFMIGSSIYPIDVHVATQGVWRMPRGEAWDKMLRYYWNRSLHVTRLIQGQFRTINFREVDGKIICDDSPENIEEQYKLSGEVSPDAVVHHGCKDGSLAKIIRSRCSELPNAPVIVAELPQPKVQTAPPRAIPTLSNVGDVKFDHGGWNIVQNSLQAAGIRPEPVLPPPSPLTPLQFEPDEVAKYRDPRAPELTTSGPFVPPMIQTPPPAKPKPQTKPPVKGSLRDQHVAKKKSAAKAKVRLQPVES